MNDLTVSPPTRLCAASGRELQEGEKVYSLLTEQDGQVVRVDYAADAWTGPPDDCIAFWLGRIPPSRRDRKPTLSDDALWDCFERLADPQGDSQQRLRYVMALLLMRRRKLKFEDTVKRDGQDWLVLRAAGRGGKRCEVLDPGLSDDDLAAAQGEVFDLLAGP